MLWHILRFDLGHLDVAARSGLEKEFARLADVPEVKWSHVGHDLEDGNVTGVVLMMDDTAALARYRQNAVHLAVGAAIKRAGARSVRLDISADLPDVPISE
jgi:hypothetical protein